MRMPMTSVRPHANAKMGRISLSLALLAGTAIGGLACLYASNARAVEQLASFLPVGQIAAVDLSNNLTSDAVSCLGGPSLNTCLVNVANQAHASGAGTVASLTSGGSQPPASGGDPGTQGSGGGSSSGTGGSSGGNNPVIGGGVGSGDNTGNGGARWRQRDCRQ